MICTIFKRQVVWSLVGFATMIFAMNYDYKKLKIWAIPLYFISQVLLVLVLFFGKEVNNSRRWFGIGSIGFQPSELAKLTLIFSWPC